jgi:hypothetical protein
MQKPVPVQGSNSEVPANTWPAIVKRLLSGK